MAETLLDFPCDFPLKVMGAAKEGFAQAAPPADALRRMREVLARIRPEFGR